MNDVMDTPNELGSWAVTEAFGDFALAPRRTRSASRGRRAKKKR
jgi:hypothetical protein